jgi:hypothetical protein
MKLSTAADGSSPGPKALPPIPGSDNNPPAPREPDQPLALESTLGTLDLRTQAEELEFQECEAIVRKGWGHFAQVGEALARIRDKRLYKNEYHSFELYCRERWGFGRSRAGTYISAAEVHQVLSAVPGIPMPECEAQVRPLVGLSPELAVQAWLNALSWTRQTYLPSRLVKRAVKQVLRKEQPAAASEQDAERQQRKRLRESIRAGFQELLTLLLGTAERPVLIAKVQEIQRLLDPLLRPKKR